MNPLFAACRVCMTMSACWLDMMSQRGSPRVNQAAVCCVCRDRKARTKAEAVAGYVICQSCSPYLRICNLIEPFWVVQSTYHPPGPRSTLFRALSFSNSVNEIGVALLAFTACQDRNDSSNSICCSKTGKICKRRADDDTSEGKR
jgi:hypothetical protein